MSRLIGCGLRAFRNSQLPLSGVGEIHFRCRLWDMDMFMELNNGRALTLYDLGRFDLAVRTGLHKVLRSQSWGLAVAGSSVHYRKRVRAGDRVLMRTQLVGYDERWFYIAQSMWVKGKPCSSILLRTCITGKTGSVPTQQVRAAMGAEDWEEPLPTWAQGWENADSLRPWPPNP